MKKITIFTILLLSCLIAVAKPPHLSVEKMFDGSFNSNKSVSLNMSRSQGKYFRGCTVTNNPGLVKKVAQLFAQDLKRAEKSQDIISDGSKYSSMTILNNGLEIFIGLSYDTDNGCYLFISGPMDAFK